MSLESFSLSGKVAVVTGGTGVLGGAIARGLAEAGARVAVMGRRAERATQVASEIEGAGGQAMALPADVLDLEQLAAARAALETTFGPPDILVNSAGGHVPAAIVHGDVTPWNLARSALDDVMALNFTGAFLPIQVFCEPMAVRGGSIVNISSMASARAITRGLGYGAAKAAIDNLTRWLAVELAFRYGSHVRVNAIAPGFFLGEQNRGLLVGPNGELTERGRKIVDHTPMGRFGEPEELVGAAVWLCSDAARFVTGIVVPVDGGFSAYSGV